jgi:hypothetical protein
MTRESIEMLFASLEHDDESFEHDDESLSARSKVSTLASIASYGLKQLMNLSIRKSGQRGNDGFLENGSLVERYFKLALAIKAESKGSMDTHIVLSVPLMSVL